jgi:serine/threonine-protein kinase
MSRHRSEDRTAIDPSLANRRVLPREAEAAPPMTTKVRYDLRRLLGQGGMGSVHLAFDTSLLREVAVKKLDPEMASADDVRRFIVEAQITGQLDHPNIIPVHDLTVEDEPSIVMKVLGGRTFADLVGSTSTPREPAVLDELLDVFLKVCDAVAFAHSKGVVHRDLKPQNVMVDTFGRVYVLDWGLARVLPGGAASAALLGVLQDERDDGSGTLAYMAPEQARPLWRPIGPATDIYALGAILYEILTGQPPHLADTVQEMRDMTFRGEIVPPDKLMPPGCVAPGLARIAMAALAREPDQRLKSAAELHTEIDRFRRGEASLPTRSFQPGEHVVEEGDAGTEAYVVQQGRCVAFKTVDGRRIVLREMSPGDVFGEMAVFSSKPRTATVEALEPLVVKVIDRAMMADGLGLNTWMGAFIQTLAERFREADDKLSRLERSADEPAT